MTWWAWILVVVVLALAVALPVPSIRAGYRRLRAEVDDLNDVVSDLAGAASRLEQAASDLQGQPDSRSTARTTGFVPGFHLDYAARRQIREDRALRHGVRHERRWARVDTVRRRWDALGLSSTSQTAHDSLDRK